MPDIATLCAFALFILILVAIAAIVAGSWLARWLFGGGRPRF